MTTENSNLKPCPSCSGTIARDARTCPHCGKTFTNAAHVILAIILAIIIAALLNL